MRVYRILFFVAIAMLMWSSSSFAGDKRQTVVWTVAHTPDESPAIVLADCGDFQVVWEWAGIVRYIEHSNPHGRLDLQWHAVLFGGWMYNSEHPEIMFPGQSGNGQRYQLDEDNGLLYSTVNIRVKVPGEGMVLRETGRVIWNLYTGETLFDSGHNQLGEGDTAALCEALAP